MTGLNLRNTTAVSLAVHIAFFALLAFTVKRQAILTPPAYTVSLVAPFDESTAGTAPASPGTPEETASTSVSEDTSSSASKNKVAIDPKKGVVAPGWLKDYKTEKLSAIKEKVERERYRSERLGAIKQKQTSATVKGSGTAPISGASAKGGGGQGKAGDAALTGYVRLVEEAIRRNWIYPDTGEGLEAVISITVLKSGAIKINGIEKSSGNPGFDGSVLKAINRASPVSPPPSEMEIGVRFFL